MKKENRLITFLACFMFFLFGVFIYYHETQAIMILSGTVGGNNCPAGTYLSHWDGTETTVTDICYNNGNSTKSMSANTCTVDANYIQCDSTEYIEWAISAGDLVDKTVGTIWFDCYVADDAIPDGIDSNDLLTASVSGANLIEAESSNSANAIYSYYDGVSSSGPLMNVDVWKRCAISWDTTNGGNDHGAYEDGVWQEDNDGLTVIAGTLTDFRVGNRDEGIDDQYIRIRDIWILTGYKTADPSP